MEPLVAEAGSSDLCSDDRLVEARPWKEREKDRLLNLMWVMFDKSSDERKLVKGKKMQLEPEEGSIADHDDRKGLDPNQIYILYLCAAQILSMPFTSTTRAPTCAYPCNALQICSIEVLVPFAGLDWPLDVFGTISVRDSADQMRNIIYSRTRDTCQNLTPEESVLTLTGPSRAVVLDPETKLVMLEVELKVKGTNESHDKYVSFLAEPVMFPTDAVGFVPFDFISKLSVLRFMLANVPDSVEATIFIRVVKGSWPVGSHGNIIVRVDSVSIVLLQFQSDKVPVGADGDVELSRHVVSVGVDKKLHLDVSYCGRVVGDGSAHFKAATNGRSITNIKIGTGMLQVLVAWSLVSPVFEGTSSWLI
ncbi:hypothetical protein PR202_ga03030 [Eleusine coracana subsp. coracana]|uniref:DUF6598 domain-containing protein n=1 Tax=Eleusine coracana subsp. coracana TaxID=191504 RepID=A0AAV5BKY8_ELECO|nr:hypothetical protein PR202_ga03030 [Eleusine coracana subsp. coracana]